MRVPGIAITCVIDRANSLPECKLQPRATDLIRTTLRPSARLPLTEIVISEPLGDKMADDIAIGTETASGRCTETAPGRGMDTASGRECKVVEVWGYLVGFLSTKLASHVIKRALAGSLAFLQFFCDLVTALC